MRNLLTSTALLLALSTPALAQDTDTYSPDPNAQPGGSITITYKDDVATLDPAIGYDWQNWSMIKSLFDGLMDYVPGTTDLRPGLAESYEISEDGLTYTFRLRPGVLFHNGREMTAEDVKFSLDRVTDPETLSPGAGFFSAIEGFDAAMAGEAEGLSGVTVADPQTVQIRLSRPDATFLHVMALNFASIVPREAVEAAGEDFGRQPVGTGAFKLAEWTLGQRLVFEKNADYWREGRALSRPDHFEVGQEPGRGAAALQSGEVGRARRRHPAREVPGGHGRPCPGRARRRGRQLHTATSP
jgi:ABC-type transport system substrate-binding protein